MRIYKVGHKILIKKKSFFSSFAAGSDYDSLSFQPLNLLSNSPEVWCYDITIIDDVDVECDDTFTVTLSLSDPLVSIDPSTTTATVSIAADSNDSEDT